MGLSELLRVGCAFLVLQLIPGTAGWGKDGHYATCKIAEEFLTEEASAAVKSLLPDYADGQLANVCSWPDEIRHSYRWRWTGPLHYIDVPDFVCNYNYCRDCHDPARHKDVCVTGAIYNYTRQLASTYYDPSPEIKCGGKLSLLIWVHPSFTADNLTEALLFLSHFMGDVHQPLHVGFTGDEGGNTIIVRWYHRKANLHHVWDNMIIDSALKTFYGSDLTNMIQAIQRNITDGSFNDVPSWGNCTLAELACPDPYASESINLACKFAYKNATPGTTLGDEYFLSRLPIVEKRLAQGGVRLAATLNRIFTPKSSIAQI